MTASGNKARIATTASVVTAMWMSWIDGCHTPLKECQDRSAVRLLSRAGELVHNRRYVDARVEYRDADDSGIVRRAAFLFGPGERVRVEFGREFAFFDGSVIGRSDQGSSDEWPRQRQLGWYGLGMLVGPVVEGRPCPLIAARHWGRAWWRYFFGEDAQIELREQVEYGGETCAVIHIRSKTYYAETELWIGRVTQHFRRFRIIRENEYEAPQRTVELNYISLEFPEDISNEEFRARSIVSLRRGWQPDT